MENDPQFYLIPKTHVFGVEFLAKCIRKKESIFIDNEIATRGGIFLRIHFYKPKHTNFILYGSALQNGQKINKIYVVYKEIFTIVNFETHMIIFTDNSKMDEKIVITLAAECDYVNEYEFKVESY